MGRPKTLAQAVDTKDPVAVYEVMLEGLARSFDKTDCTRDKAQLANRIMDATDRLAELGWTVPDVPGRRKDAEVTPFEVIAGNRAARRDAASG